MLYETDESKWKAKERWSEKGYSVKLGNLSIYRNIYPEEGSVTAIRDTGTYS
jgi:hypothetical protein